jgi:hypothetical protein
MKNLIAAFVLLFGLNTISGQQMPGFFNYEIGTDGKLELQISSSQLNEEFLYVNSLSAGIVDSLVQRE